MGRVGSDQERRRCSPGHHQSVAEQDRRRIDVPTLLANAAPAHAQPSESATYTNAIARNYAEAGYDDFAAVVEAGHGCAACHLTHFINRVPTNAEIDLQRYQEVASTAGKLRMVVEVLATGFIGAVGQAERLTVGELLAVRSQTAPASLGGSTRLFQAGDLLGVEPASEELMAAVRAKGRTLVIAADGSEELRMLDYFGAEASVGGEGMNHVILRPNPSKPALLRSSSTGLNIGWELSNAWVSLVPRST